MSRAVMTCCGTGAGLGRRHLGGTGAGVGGQAAERERANGWRVNWKRESESKLYRRKRQEGPKRWWLVLPSVCILWSLRMYQILETSWYYAVVPGFQYPESWWGTSHQDCHKQPLLLDYQMIYQHNLLSFCSPMSRTMSNRFHRHMQGMDERRFFDAIRFLGSDMAVPTSNAALSLRVSSAWGRRRRLLVSSS
jgi:hypothetical protein